MNNRKKTLVYYTVNGDHALFHTSKTAKMIKANILGPGGAYSVKSRKYNLLAIYSSPAANILDYSY